MRDFIDYLQEAFITASGGNTYDTSVRVNPLLTLEYLLPSTDD
jgi:hypothetical protein